MTPMQRVDILRAACCVAGIDGDITEAENAVISKLAKEAGVGRASLEAMMDRGATDPNFHQDQFRVLKEDPQESMAALLEVAMADGQLSDSESEVLRALSRKLSITSEVFDQLISAVNQMLD
jgi:tellurite resistance protein